MNEGKNKIQGQFLIITAIGLIIILISLSLLLIYSSTSNIYLEKSNFRRLVTELNLNFRKALATSLAEVTNKLDFEAVKTRYSTYLSLEELPNASDCGYAFINDWQMAVLKAYSGIGLNLSISKPVFVCSWNSSVGISRVTSKICLDILSYGFYGWAETCTIELNLTVLNLDLNGTDGKTVSFYFMFVREEGTPAEAVSSDHVQILFKHAESNQFSPSKKYKLIYLGDGMYHASFSMYNFTVLEGLRQIKDYIWKNMTESDFKPEYSENITETKSILCNLVNEVEKEYNNTSLEEAYFNLTFNIKPKLDPNAPNSSRWVTEDAETSYVLALVDMVRSQIVPTVRLVLRNRQGIVVSASSTLKRCLEDDEGPQVRNIQVRPSPTYGSQKITLTAVIDDVLTGLSNIAYAEFFVGEIGSNGSGEPLSPVDGKLDSPIEEVYAVINVSDWFPSNYTIYIHGKDSSGRWGEIGSVKIEVIEGKVMYVCGIDLSIEYRKIFIWKFCRAKAIVTIKDTKGNLVANAIVTGYWSGSARGKVRGQTDYDGKVTFYSPWTWAWGNPSFTFTVDNVTLTGYYYDPSLNVETSDTIQV